MADDVHFIASGRMMASDVARHSFTTIRRGLDPREVRAYLDQVARELENWEQREKELRRVLEEAQERARNPVIDESTLSAALGQQSASILRNAHEEAARILRQSEEEAAALVREAQAHAAEIQVAAEAAAAERIADAEIAVGSVRQQAQDQVVEMLDASRAEGEQMIEAARAQGRSLVEEAQETRQRVLSDMAQRRRSMTLQIEQFRAARDELSASVMGLRESVDRVLSDLSETDNRARAAAARVTLQGATGQSELVDPVDSEPVDEVDSEPPDGSSPSSIAVPAPVAGPTQLSASEPLAPAGSQDTKSPDVGTSDLGDSMAELEAADEVESLFARLRASRASGVSPGAAQLSGEPAVTTAGPEEVETDDLPSAPHSPERSVSSPPSSAGPDAQSGSSENTDDLVRRATLLDPVIAQLSRRTKRALQDDQNRLLDRLRSNPGSWSADLLLPEDEQRRHYREAVSDLLGEAFSAGKQVAGEDHAGEPRGEGIAGGADPDSASVVAIAERLAGSLLASLRRRLEGAAAGLDSGAAAESIGAAYREWRGERVERAVGDAALEAFCAGVLAVAGSGTAVRWVVGGPDPSCADCDDNSLAGAVRPGQEFPTGHRHPPAHPGCRCLLVVSPAPDD